MARLFNHEPVLGMMMEHLYAVYIMSSHSGVLYIGITNDLQRRVEEHKAGAIDGFTKKYKCNRLVYYETYGDVRRAIAREKQLRAGHARKRLL